MVIILVGRFDGSVIVTSVGFDRVRIPAFDLYNFFAFTSSVMV